MNSRIANPGASVHGDLGGSWLWEALAFFLFVHLLVMYFSQTDKLGTHLRVQIHGLLSLDELQDVGPARGRDHGRTTQ